MTDLFKKADIKLDYAKYGRFMYTGSNYLLMRINHIMLGLGVAPDQNKHILEIGGGTNPHYEWMKNISFESYTISDVENHINSMPSNIHFIPSDELDPDLYEKKFTRVIASHVLEHLPDPELQILNWVSMLKDDGILSIALPCDPGFLWHLCRRLSLGKAKKVYQITKEERNLIMAREHINSIYNLLYILEYYFHKKKIRWFPAILPINNINLLCVITLRKSDFRMLS